MPLEIRDQTALSVSRLLKKPVNLNSVEGSADNCPIFSFFDPINSHEAAGQKQL